MSPDIQFKSVYFNYFFLLLYEGVAMAHHDRIEIDVQVDDEFDSIESLDVEMEDDISEVEEDSSEYLEYQLFKNVGRTEKCKVCLELGHLLIIMKQAGLSPVSI